MTNRLYVVNKSSQVTDNETQMMCAAIAYQMRYHAAPQWGRRGLAPVFSTDDALKPAPGAAVIGLLDNPDQAGALGWHTEDAGGIVHGEVFTGPIFSHNGNALTANLSVASVLDHEVLETWIDPSVNGWCDAFNGTAYATEIGDPVESDAYGVPTTDPTTGATVNVMLSNFVTPAYFDPQAAPGSRFDWMRKLTGPFQMTPGGYVVVMKDGVVSQKYGETFPEWRKHHKRRPGANRRQQQGH